MKSAHILLVEDNEGDIVLTHEAFISGKLKNKISITRDGEEALDFLYKRKGYEDQEKPDLILLDINLPKINGLEILGIIKKEAALKSIPVVMLTTSSDNSDMQKAYSNNIACYITKPIDFSKFSKAVLEIDSFWLNLVTVSTAEA